MHTIQSSSALNRVLAVASVNQMLFNVGNSVHRAIQISPQPIPFLFWLRHVCGRMGTRHVTASDLPARLEVIEMRRSLMKACIHVASLITNS